MTYAGINWVAMGMEMMLAVGLIAAVVGGIRFLRRRRP